jgi:hypothetical protein
MNYTPNFSDARVKRKIEHSLNWVNTYLKPGKDQWLSQREIQKQFGSLSRPLGRWIRDTLLICVNPYFNNLTGQCKTYRINESGFNYAAQQTGYKEQLLVPNKVQDELSTGDFEYKDIGHREYHWLQNLPKRKKVETLAYHGYRYEYDIQCAAQTLCLQYACSLGFTDQTPALDQYINDRSSVRQSIAQRTGLDTDTVKKILTALLNGASISAWHDNTIFSYVNYNKLMIEHIKTDEYIQQYQRDVRSMWKSVRKYQNLKFKERFNAKMKSEIYRSLEESVRVVVKKYLKKSNNRALIEHDGWSSQTAVDIDRLIYEVKQQTGFVIKLDWTIHEYIDCY